MSENESELPGETDPRAKAFEPCPFWSDGRHCWRDRTTTAGSDSLLGGLGAAMAEMRGFAAVKNCACGAAVESRPGARAK